MNHTEPANPDGRHEGSAPYPGVLRCTAIMTGFAVIGIMLAQLADINKPLLPELRTTATVVLILVPLHLATTAMLHAARQLGSGDQPGHAVALLVPTPLLVAPAFIGLNPLTTSSVLGTSLAAGALVVARLQKHSPIN